MSLAPKRVVVLDTNLFLHYKRPDQLDWAGLQCDNVELVVLAVVIRELEKAKNFGSSARLRTRAAETITWLSKLMDEGFEVELRKGLWLRFEINEPAIDFAQQNLVRELQDDVLIAGLLNLAQTTPEPPWMATADLGVKSKTRQRGFKVFAPPETDKLAEEPDPRDKELLDLRRENQQYKNRQPRLKVAFATKETRLKVLPLISSTSSEPASLDEVKRLHPLLISSANATNPLFHSEITDAIMSTSESRRQRYNDELEQYYGKYEKYRNRILKLRQMERCRVELPIILLNEGTAPATDIDVSMTFAQDTFALKDLKLFERPERPKPPQKPVRGISEYGIYNNPLPDFHNFSPPPGLFPREVLSWSVEVEGNTAHVHLDRLKPGLTWEMPTLWLQFTGEEALRSTTVEVDVSVAESLGREDHQLHIIILKN
jgi:hypothetical protein